MEDKVDTFKHKLRSYNGDLKDIKVLEEFIEDLYYMLGGARAIDPSKIPTHSLPNKDAEYKLREKIENYKRVLKHKQDSIAYVDSKLDMLDKEMRDKVVQVCIEKNTLEKISRKYFLSKHALQYQIDTALSKILP